MNEKDVYKKELITSGQNLKIHLYYCTSQSPKRVQPFFLQKQLHMSLHLITRNTARCKAEQLCSYLLPESPPGLIM